MSTAETIADIEYPESDGKPMGETDLHRYWMKRIDDLLSYRYRGQQVYVSSDLLLYYREGWPTHYVVPDDFVVKDIEPGMRRTYKIWEEGKAPDVVFEVTSKKTRREDESHKPQIYERIGVKELFLYDPTADYLKPPLRGFRVTPDGLMRLRPDAGGALQCEQLGLLLRLEGRRLEMIDAASGESLLTEAEAEREAREREQAAKEREQAARKREQLARRREKAAREREQAAREAAETAARAAEQRAAAAEEELRRLRDEMKKRRGK